MSENRSVHFIPPRPIRRERRVGIYCRVSSNSTEQLNSLTNQVSALTRLIAATQNWLLVDTYIDIASGKKGSKRAEYTRMLEDCQAKNIEIVITKNISRFGRDTVEVLESLNKLREHGVRVIFEQEGLDTADTDSELMISIIESIAQAENESRSENIKWGYRRHAAQGTSKLYNRKCYGYENDEDGELIIKKNEAKNVRLIFSLYLQGHSIIGIKRELEKREIKTPTGKEKWSKRTIDVMLSNEKYIGVVRLLHSNEYEEHFVSENNHPAIISKEQFEAVQEEKIKRSNVVKGEDGSKRKGSKYSSKNSKDKQLVGNIQNGI
ncbi:DNA invertase Pin-like site-specific DNA recombinase [Oikeobacillus pervagus]|uniref:DNA invertase Pin-like site-specific DNA recombinase n=1 Tax=Oikeobacillus pervagus TaxID=1325931 RepID=A0AAJ1T7J0_9BACI|nr:recombinase family protein [Oikeobacillus pervagus]MDQ0216576.1 DNA invertase Pin-like site-specific DNA recombinase [Oikeobacillus pervagus]